MAVINEARLADSHLLWTGIFFSSQAISGYNRYASIRPIMKGSKTCQNIQRSAKTIIRIAVKAIRRHCLLKIFVDVSKLVV